MVKWDTLIVIAQHTSDATVADCMVTARGTVALGEEDVTQGTITKARGTNRLMRQTNGLDSEWGDKSSSQ